MDLAECKRKGYIKPTKINPPLARSLLEMSDAKKQTIRDSSLNDTSISPFLSMAYDALREI